MVKQNGAIQYEFHSLQYKNTTQYLHIQKSKLISITAYSQMTEAEKDVIFVLIATALRQARRDRQLVSKRLLPSEDEDQPEVTMDTNSGEQVGRCGG